MPPSKALEQNAIEARCIRQCVLMTATSTSAGAVLLWAVLPQLAVVLLSLPFKSCGWHLTVVPSSSRSGVAAHGPRQTQSRLSGARPAPYLCWRCLALGGAATARGGAPQPVVQELRV